MSYVRKLLTITHADGEGSTQDIRGELVTVAYQEVSGDAYAGSPVVSVEILHQDFAALPVLTDVAVSGNATWHPRPQANQADGAAVARNAAHAVAEGKVKVTVSGATGGAGKFLLILKR